MFVASTSMEAFKKLKNVEFKRDTVLRMIEEQGPICNYSIAYNLNWEINRVTPRVNELAEMGRVQVAYKDIGPTGRRVKHWLAIPQQQVLV